MPVNSVKNRRNERPADALPQWHAGLNPESDDEKVRSMLRRAQASTMVASSGDVANGKFSTGAQNTDLSLQTTTTSLTPTTLLRIRTKPSQSRLAVDDVSNCDGTDLEELLVCANGDSMHGSITIPHSRTMEAD
jgi:hypothetical protein